ncbi:MAG: ABC transporter ATP-binding protein [Saprospiraceae bacterium]|nr:ABC transporter ATP-binding protein [Saprospiraceae bacterium]
MLHLNNLDIGYNKKINIQPINGNFILGNLVVLLGRNGTGKTTLLKTMSKFLSPINGSVSIKGDSLDTISAKDLSQTLSIVNTERIQIPYLTVYDLIALGRYPYLGFLGKLRETDHQFIESILNDLTIDHLKDKYITSCSDGEQQMVMLARALAQDTPIILLDEATAHLDFINRIKIFHTLQTLAHKNNKLIFMATHDLQIALKYADKVILFLDGKIEINSTQYFLDNQSIDSVFSIEGVDYKLL